LSGFRQVHNSLGICNENNHGIIADRKALVQGMLSAGRTAIGGFYSDFTEAVSTVGLELESIPAGQESKLVAEVDDLTKAMSANSEGVRTMKKQLIGMLLIVVSSLVWDSGPALASKAGPDRAVVEREARQIEQITADNNLDELIEMLAIGTFPSKVKVAMYLKDSGQRKALEELERANKEFGGWNLETPCDDRSGVFALAIWKIKTQDASSAERIDALLELIESRGPIVPESKTYDTVTINGASQKRLRAQRPNYDLGLCAEQELERFGDPSLTARLRKSENKGVAAYAVWREVRDMPAEPAIARCVDIVHNEGRTQQYGAIHCLQRFEHPNAVLALDVLAYEGYSEAVRALNHFGSKPDVFERICNHLLGNPYHVVRLFAVSPVRILRTESLRGESLKTLVRALYDPSEQVRRSAAQSLCNYIYPVTRSDLMAVRQDLLFARRHPDTEVRSRINKVLERIGWLDPDMPKGDAPVIRTDMEARAYSKGGGLERKKRMVALLEVQGKAALEKGDDDEAREIYRKLLILEPENEAYRSYLPEEAPRFIVYYTKNSQYDGRPEDAELDEYWLFTENQIESYDWDTHTITLSKEGVQRIPASSTIGVRGRSFVVVADGQRCYLGAFWSSFSSISCSLPVINTFRLHRTCK